MEQDLINFFHLILRSHSKDTITGNSIIKILKNPENKVGNLIIETEIEDRLITENIIPIIGK